MAKRTVNRLPIVRSLIARRSLIGATFLAVLCFFALPEDWRQVTRLLSAWDFGIAFYLILAVIAISRSDNQIIRRRAASQDEGGLLILGLTVFGASASIAAIMHELVAAKNLAGHAESQAVLLAAVTVLLSWIFIQTMFAFHYAHEFYKSGQDDAAGGLEFPAHYKTPDYWDFIYFSFTIGTAAQTADINITSKVIRRIVTFQCVIIFFFNTTILALAINIGAGLAA